MKRLAVVLVLLQLMVIAPKPAHASGVPDLVGDIATYFYLLNKRCIDARIPSQRIKTGAPRSVQGNGPDSVAKPKLKLKVGAEKS